MLAQSSSTIVSASFIFRRDQNGTDRRRQALARKTPSARACFSLPLDQTFSMNDELAERLTRLESTIAHLEHLTDRLNEVVTEQGRELQRLKHGFQRQAQSLETIELDRIRSTDPKPPHYE
jgi:SlyX protein